MNFKLIVEAFNVFNRQNITTVRTNLYNVSGGVLVPQTTGSTAFGLPTGDIGPRILQLAAKIVF